VISKFKNKKLKKRLRKGTVNASVLSSRKRSQQRVHATYLSPNLVFQQIVASVRDICANIKSSLYKTCDIYTNIQQSVEEQVEEETLQL
jgi:hypothetical protein